MSCGDVSPGWGTNNKGTQDDGLDPDVTMMGVARHKDRFFSHSLFYEQARDGTLPAFSWISPKHEAADHPCLDIAPHLPVFGRFHLHWSPVCLRCRGIRVSRCPFSR